MPFERARETLTAMRAFDDPPKVVIVTMFESPRYVQGAGRGRGQRLPAEDLLRRAPRRRGARRGLRPERGARRGGDAARDARARREGADGALTARQLEILLLAARGLSNGRIASSLHISEATVKRHLANVYEKMGVGSRGEAAREALLRDWITIEEIKEPPDKDGAEAGPPSRRQPGVASRPASPAAPSTARSSPSADMSCASEAAPSAHTLASMESE